MFWLKWVYLSKDETRHYDREVEMGRTCREHQTYVKQKGKGAKRHGEG